MNEIYNYYRHFFIYTPRQLMKSSNIVLYNQYQGAGGCVPLRAVNLESAPPPFKNGDFMFSKITECNFPSKPQKTHPEKSV